MIGAPILDTISHQLVALQVTLGFIALFGVLVLVPLRAKRQWGHNNDEKQRNWYRFFALMFIFSGLVFIIFVAKNRAIASIVYSDFWGSSAIPYWEDLPDDVYLYAARYLCVFTMLGAWIAGLPLLRRTMLPLWGINVVYLLSSWMLLQMKAVYYWHVVSGAFLITGFCLFWFYQEARSISNGDWMNRLSYTAIVYPIINQILLGWFVFYPTISKIGAYSPQTYPTEFTRDYSMEVIKLSLGMQSIFFLVGLAFILFISEKIRPVKNKKPV